MSQKYYFARGAASGARQLRDLLHPSSSQGADSFELELIKAGAKIAGPSSPINSHVNSYLFFSRRNWAYFDRFMEKQRWTRLWLFFRKLRLYQDVRIFFPMAAGPLSEHLIYRFASEHGHYYHVGRWVPGILTNTSKISQVIRPEIINQSMRERRYPPHYMPATPHLAFIFDYKNLSSCLKEMVDQRMAIWGMLSTTAEPRHLLQAFPASCSTPKSLLLFLRLFKALKLF